MTKQQRNRYSDEFKAEALKLAENTSVASAARKLELHESKIYGWRSAANKKASIPGRETELATENARLKRQLSEQGEELAILKKSGHLLREEPKITRYGFMHEHSHQFTVRRMAAVLGVSRSGFYRWQQNLEAAGPNEKWAGDITYLMTSEGWLYLAVMMDLHSRTVIGWSMSTKMTAELVSDALEMALWRRNFPQGVIVHSDRGSQYCSHRYHYLIQKHALRQSMSRKGNCWDTQSRVLIEHGGSA